MHLYELTEQYQKLNILLDEGAQDEALKSEIANIQEKLTDKVKNIGKFILSLEGEAQTIKTEVERLVARKQVTEKKIAWLESYLLNEMVISGLEKVKGALLTVSVAKNPPSVNIINQDLVPKDFRRTIPESWVVDRVKILENFRNTAEIPDGCEIITNKKSLRIK